MNKILIEAKNKNTPEYRFLKAILAKFFPTCETNFIFMDGVGNLFSEPIRIQMLQAEVAGEPVLVLVDADTVDKGNGYKKRKTEIENGMSKSGVQFPYFIYPDNGGDGDVETLMLAAARYDKHKIFFDCFNDYERCVSASYQVPNLKGKLHTYITAQKLSSRQRQKIGSGDWLFEEEDYWDLNVKDLEPLIQFFSDNLK